LRSTEQFTCKVDVPAVPDRAACGARTVHLTTSSRSGWRLWRDAVLRSAGFPARLVHLLADEALGEAADMLDAADTALDAACSEALHIVSDQIFEQRAAKLENRVDLELLRKLTRATKALRRRVDAPVLADVVPADIHERIVALERERVRRAEAYQEAYARALVQTTAAIGTASAEPLFQEAVTWQNHAAFDLVLMRLANGDGMSGSKRNQREALVANYLQRYCLKNDTIGFFGPLAWIRLAAANEGSTLEVGHRLVRHRTVRFEDWPVAALARKFAQREEMLPWLVPRQQPYLLLKGRRLVLPGEAEIELTAAQALVIAACDGMRSAREVARLVLGNPFAPFAGGEAQVFAILRELEVADRISLGFPVSSCDPLPEEALRRQLLGIDEERIRGAALSPLDALVAARQAIAEATGDANRLKERMADLDQLFCDLTGQQSRRRGGEVYGGRALVYEDCHRNVSLVMGERAQAGYRHALDLILMSARWFTSEAAQRFSAEFVAAHARLLAGAGRSDGREVPFCDFWLSIQTSLFGDFAPVVELAAALRQKWEAMLRPFMVDGPRRVELGADDIISAATKAFPSETAGWKLARHQCPDLMFCAPDAASLLRGDFLAVLGEVHLGGNTVGTNLFFSQHPRPQSFFDAMRSDLGFPYVLPKLSPEAAGTPIRTQWVDDAQGCIEVLFSRDLVPANPETAIPIGELSVSREGNRLVAKRMRDGWCADLLDVLSDFLSLSVMNRFGILNKGRHTPRITIDRLVVQREAWQFDRCELAGLLVRDEKAEGFRVTRAWAASKGLPRAVFVTVAWEDKPFFVDFASAIFVRLLVKQLRSAEEAGRPPGDKVSITEMLPDFDGLWLTDAGKQRYTSELRLVCIHQDDAARD
jgi:hypothetical protein